MGQAKKNSSLSNVDNQKRNVVIIIQDCVKVLSKVLGIFQ